MRVDRHVGPVDPMKFWTRLMNACGVLAALVVGAITLLVGVDVAGRNLAVASLPWIVDVTELALPLATLLAAPWLLHRNEHVRMDVIHTRLSPLARGLVDRVASLIGLAVCVAIAWYAVAVIRDDIAIGAMVMKSLVFPEWWQFAPVPVSFGLMALEFARRLVQPPRREG